MSFDALTVGSTISQYPLKDLVLSMAQGIADAQAALDKSSISAAMQLIDQTLTIKGETKSLLELGFLPSFYHFQQAKIKVSVEITMKIEESTQQSFGVGISLSGSSKSKGADDEPADGGGDEPADGGGDEPADGGGDEPADGGGDEPADEGDD